MSAATVGGSAIFIHRTHPMRIPCVSSELYATTFAEEPMGVRLPPMLAPSDTAQTIRAVARTDGMSDRSRIT